MDESKEEKEYTKEKERLDGYERCGKSYPRTL